MFWCSGAKWVNTTPSWSQNITQCIFLVDLSLRNFCGEGAFGANHCMLHCLGSGSYMYIHVSSPVIMLEKNLLPWERYWDRRRVQTSTLVARFSASRKWGVRPSTATLSKTVYPLWDEGRVWQSIFFSSLTSLISKVQTMSYFLLEWVATTKLVNFKCVFFYRKLNSLQHGTFSNDQCLITSEV